MAVPLRWFALFTPTGLRHWLAASVVNRLTFSAVLLTMSVVAVIGLIATTISYLQIRDSVRKELNAEATLMEEYLASSLHRLTRELSSLAANPLMVNGLLDSQGRETYLQPFLLNYRSPLGLRTNLALHDFQGGAIAGSNPGAQPATIGASWLEETIGHGKPYAEIRQGQFGKSLFLAYPVLFPTTGLAEGVLVCEVDFDELYRGLLKLSEKSRFSRHLLVGGEHTGLHEHSELVQSFLITRMVRTDAPLDRLDLEVRVSIARHDLITPVYWMTAAYFAVGTLLLVGVVWLTRRVVGRIAQPLLELSEASDSLAVSNLAAAKVPVRGHDEIGRLATSFNGMIEELNQSYRMLERKVEERTRTLRATEAELRARQRDYLVIFDSVRAAVAYLDREGKVVRANQRACRQIGYGEEEIIGRTPLELVPGEQGAKYHRENLQAMATGEAYYGQLEQRSTEDGELHWFLVDRIPSRGDAGEVTGLTVFMVDIDERIAMEEQLRQLNETLEQRVRDELAKNREKDVLMIQQSRLAAMGEMIGNIAHQWRQPLNTLGLILANIKDSHDFGELTSAYLDNAVNQGEVLIQKMSTTIDDFRNFFRPNRTPLPFSLSKAVAEALQLVGASFQNNDIAITINVIEDAQVEGFPNEYSQVLLNILNNAKDALLAHRMAERAVAVEVGRTGEMAYVRVRDNGGGIPDAVMGKIFDPYFTTRDKGTGIGLYMSKMIIESNMNGRIAVRNTGDGAEFAVYTPCATRQGES